MLDRGATSRRDAKLSSDRNAKAEEQTGPPEQKLPQAPRTHGKRLGTVCGGPVAWEKGNWQPPGRVGLPR